MPIDPRAPKTHIQDPGAAVRIRDLERQVGQLLRTTTARTGAPGPAWVDLDFDDVAFEAAFSTTPAYYRDTLGRVFFRGALTAIDVPGTSAPVTITTMPAGWWPAEDTQYVVTAIHDANPALARILVNADGTLQVLGHLDDSGLYDLDNGTTFWIDPVQFRVV